MRLPVFVTSALLLLIALFPCYQFGILEPNNNVRTLHAWMFILRKEHPSDQLRFFPKEAGVCWNVMWAEILGAFAVGGMVWAVLPRRKQG
jgi:hypothetical protein